MLVARRRAFATKSLTFLGTSLTDVKVEARANRDYFLSPRIAFDAKPYTDPVKKAFMRRELARVWSEFLCPVCGRHMK
ncbi:unnamed protein product [Brassica oleracea var. botrytis]